MATVNYKCPNCGGPLKFNPDKQMFSCEYCMADFTEEKIQQLYAEQEAKQSSAEKAEQKAEEKKTEQQKSNDNPENSDEEEAVVYTCPSCGAEVVTTASTAATTCYYCQNPVVLGGRLSGKFKPDRVVTFALTKEKAVEKFIEMCKKKYFLPKDFANEKQFEKMTGVYFPYWYVDEKKQAHMSAECEKVSTWSSGDDDYTETSYYDVERDGDFDINNVFERALKDQNRDMLQCVHPFDLEKAKPFSMSFLSGFQAEKRDIEKEEIQESVEERMRNYCKELLQNSMSDYTAVHPKNYIDKNLSQVWNYTLLPVWVVTYKFNNMIFPFAINGQTGKTYGKLPVSIGKMILLFISLAIVLFALGLCGGMLLA